MGHLEHGKEWINSIITPDDTHSTSSVGQGRVVVDTPELTVSFTLNTAQLLFYSGGSILVYTVSVGSSGPGDEGLLH